jgi:lysozyme
MDALNGNSQLVNFICTQEGFEANAYKDSAGVWTVGFGFTGKMHDDRDVIDVRNLSLDVAKQELAYRLTALLDELKALCGDVELTENQASALASLAYNVGSTALSKSMLIRKIKAKDFIGASDEFQRWALCGGKPMRGLKLRRHREAILFLS